MIRHQPDAPLLECAINDAHNCAHEQDELDAGISQAESCANSNTSNTLISGIQTALPNCEITLWTTNPTFDATGSLMRGATVKRYYQGVREVASARGLRPSDAENFWNFFRQRDEDECCALIPDGVHPTRHALRQYLVPFLMDECGVPAKTL